MSRDRRWCQGNLQHLRLLFTEGLFGAHRTLFLNGALSYVSALLVGDLPPAQHLGGGRQRVLRARLLPVRTEPLSGVAGLAAELGALAARGHRHDPVRAEDPERPLDRRARAGGARSAACCALLASVVLDVVLSSLLAPIRMAFHSRFVFTNLIGRTVVWRSQTARGRRDVVGRRDPRPRLRHRLRERLGRRALRA